MSVYYTILIWYRIILNSTAELSTPGAKYTYARTSPGAAVFTFSFLANHFVVEMYGRVELLLCRIISTYCLITSIS